MKKIISLSLLTLGANGVFAQAANAPANASVWDDPTVLFYTVIGFLVVTGLLILITAFAMLRVVRILTRQASEEKAKRLGIEYKPEPTFWENLWQKSNDFVPLEKEKDLIMADHSYDGIQELDNHLPPWWTGLFYVTIAFSVVYLLAFHVFDSLPLSKAEYENEVAYAKDQAAKNQAAQPVATIDENNVGIVKDAQALAEGKQIFLNNCASCHRKDAGGDIGPNLTDEHWIHGGTVNDVFKTIKHGAAGTNMIAWEGFISPEKMKNVANYILTLQGSNPANPKKPQGNLFKAESAVEQKADSVKTAN
jgi:cytochrome c oxidase cbb3-type subunit 3